MPAANHSELGFVLDEELDGRHLIVPLVDGSPLGDLTERYEQDRGMDNPGGYGGIVAERCRTETLPDYYRGLRHSYPEARRVPWASRARRRFGRSDVSTSRIQVLACAGCGEGGCWPGEILVTTSAGDVTWSDFRNPHRPGRDYSDLGPFTFARRQYDDALDDLMARLHLLA